MPPWIFIHSTDQGWNYRLVIDNRWRFSLLFFYRILIRLYFFTIDFQPYGWNYRLSSINRWRYSLLFFLSLLFHYRFPTLVLINFQSYFFSPPPSEIFLPTPLHHKHHFHLVLLN